MTYMASQSAGLPKMHSALVLSSPGDPPEVKTVLTLFPTSAARWSALSLLVGVPYMCDIYNGSRQYLYPTPLLLWSDFAASNVWPPSDPTYNHDRGQLMLVDSTICGPDDPVAIFLSGVHEGFTDGTWKLMHGEWKDLTYADCVEASLENYFVLNERRFLDVGGG